jgi:LacI family transcriptional regulator
LRKTRQVTLSDIAQIVNVSKVTVSKALRGHPDISAETVEKIKVVAKELGYYPNFMARNLSSQKSNTIGVIVPKIAHSFFASVIESIYDTAFKNNYEVILTVSQENSDRELKHIHSLLSMRVDGLLVSISQQTIDFSIFKTVKERGIPLTFMDRVVEDPQFNAVTVDDQGGSFAATEQAISIGYRKLAHVAGFQHINIGRARYRGFEQAMKKHNLPIRPEWVVFGGFGENDGYEGFKKICAADERPEFVLAATYPVALGIYRAAAELGLNIPSDIDIICFGKSISNRFLSPSMTYVEQPTEEIGRKAVEITLENIRKGDQFESKQIVLPTTLVMGETCRKKVEK